jgi:hypothetical protein
MKSERGKITQWKMYLAVHKSCAMTPSHEKVLISLFVTTPYMLPLRNIYCDVSTQCQATDQWTCILTRDTCFLWGPTRVYIIESNSEASSCRSTKEYKEYKEYQNENWRGTTELLVGNSRGKLVVEEELEFSLWRLGVWLEGLVTVRLLIPLPGYDSWRLRILVRV